MLKIALDQLYISPTGFSKVLNTDDSPFSKSCGTGYLDFENGCHWDSTISFLIVSVLHRKLKFEFSTINPPRVKISFLFFDISRTIDRTRAVHIILTYRVYENI